MIETIKPLRRLPPKIKIGGDYTWTQIALILAGLATGPSRITGFNRGRDTFRTLDLLDEMGCRVTRDAVEIVIENGDDAELPECPEFNYDGGVLPLVLIIGVLIGKNRECTLIYSDAINPDLVDRIVHEVNGYGLDIFHLADTRRLIIRHSTELPLEVTCHSIVPYIKQCLLMVGLGGNRTVRLKEMTATDDTLERLIERFGGRISSEEIKGRWDQDPDDPRKKILVRQAEHKREINLDKGNCLKGIDFEPPGDYGSFLAITELAGLKRGPVKILGMLRDNRLMQLSRVMKTLNIDLDLEKRHLHDGLPVADVTVTGRRLKGRKISGDMATGLTAEWPYIAVMLAYGDGNSLIRDIGELYAWAREPFGEMIRYLETMGVKAGALGDGLIIEGEREIEFERLGPFDNRDVALAFYMTALAAPAKTEFEGFEIIRDNFPDLVDSIRDSYDRQLLSRPG